MFILNVCIGPCVSVSVSVYLSVSVTWIVSWCVAYHSTSLFFVSKTARLFIVLPTTLSITFVAVLDGFNDCTGLLKPWFTIKRRYIFYHEPWFQLTRRFIRTIKDDAWVMDNVVGEENRDAVLESLMVPTTVVRA